jgi:hypothetical protein
MVTLSIRPIRTVYRRDGSLKTFVPMKTAATGDLSSNTTEGRNTPTALKDFRRN